MKKILFIILALSLLAEAGAQELRCGLSVNYSKIQGTNQSIFTTLQKDLQDFVNNTAWTNNLFATDERIECNIFINITEQLSANEFRATLQVQSSRPVFGSTFITPMFNYMDNEVLFTYIEYDQIQFNEQVYTSPLPSLIAFYCYIMLGLDYDSFSLLGGTEYLKKAENIVLNAQNAPVKGWRPYDGSRTNRYWMIENMLNYKYGPMRNVYYKYHRLGLDLMNTSVSDGRIGVMEALLDIQRVHRDRPDTYLFLLKLFFDAKADEIVNIFLEAPETERMRAYQILVEVDKMNEKKYVKLKNVATPF
ncbi:MAG: DUF4835 family protein [Prevotellaceae bacterium]|jgi:hypothetical protein|nr:DUF4835 family protein [Prevotellaceae bacterium]